MCVFQLVFLFFNVFNKRHTNKNLNLQKETFSDRSIGQNLGHLWVGNKLFLVWPALCWDSTYGCFDNQSQKTDLRNIQYLHDSYLELYQGQRFTISNLLSVVGENRVVEI